jgi:hypothetical protein
MEKLADLQPAFVLDQEAVLGPIRLQLEKLERNLVRRG